MLGRCAFLEYEPIWQIHSISCKYCLKTMGGGGGNADVSHQKQRETIVKQTVPVGKQSGGDGESTMRTPAAAADRDPDCQSRQSAERWGTNLEPPGLFSEDKALQKRNDCYLPKSSHS